MSPLMTLVRRLVHSEGGATAVEYGLLVAVLSIVVAAAVRLAGTSLFNTMSNVSANIAGT